MEIKSSEEVCTEQKLNHKKWRALIKKQKRKLRRQAEAKQLETEKEHEEESPGRQAREEFEVRQQQIKEQYQETLKQALHQTWLQREYRAAEQFKQKLLWERREKERIAEQERRIREEWEERQKKEKEEEEEKKKRQEELLKEATKNEKKQNEDGSWHNPLAPPRIPGVERENCPFFLKVGACRFGDRCSRGHPYPDTSTTIMLPGMYSHYKLEHGMKDEYDADIGLEYEDSETFQHFKEFYHDTLPEFQKFGRIVQYRVCANFEPHLRGNVYVQFSREQDAMKACSAFHCRWYAGRQLNCHLSCVETWKQAICGLYFSNRCPKGKTCNFLHTFPNPGNAFRVLDRHDVHRLERIHSSSRSTRQRRSRSRSGSRSRSRSRSPHRWRRRRRSRSRSRSLSPRHRYRNRRRSRSKSPYERKRNRSRSPDRKRYRSRSPNGKRYRSRSPNGKQYRSRSPRERSSRRSLDRYSSSGHRRRSPGERYSSSSRRSLKRSQSSSSESRSRSNTRSLSRSPDHGRSKSGSRSRSNSPTKRKAKNKKSKKSNKKHKEKKEGNFGSKNNSSNTAIEKNNKCDSGSSVKSSLNIEETSDSLPKVASVRDLMRNLPNTEVTDANIVERLENKDKALEFLDSVLADIGSN